MKTIRFGDYGREVRVLQHLLGLESDGDFGPKTEAKLKKWQRAQGQTASGVCDGETWASLAAALPQIASGSRGRFVQAAQLIVGADPDGIFGPDTLAAVRAWQAAEQLSETGVVARADWQAMLGFSAGEPLEDLPDAVWIPGTQPVDYKQTDPRWKDRAYTVTGDSSQTIGSSGCGPAAMADIIATWFDERVTPVEMCALGVKWGFRTQNSGTSHGFFKKCAAKWPFSAYTGTSSFATAKAALEQGALVIANMGPGYWTKGGHYICCYRHANGRIWANDPASKTRSSQDDSSFAAQAKYFAIFYR